MQPSTVELVCILLFVLAGIFTIVTVFIFFKYNIRDVYFFLTGKKERKIVSKIKDEVNDSNNNIANQIYGKDDNYKTDNNDKVESNYKTENSGKVKNSYQAKNKMDESKKSFPNTRIDKTENLDEIVDRTEDLDDEDSQSFFKMEKSIDVIHTDDTI